MPAAKYADFVLSEPISRNDRSKLNERLYQAIKCPHCKDEFAHIPTERVQNGKAGYCKAHLAKCPSYECPSCDEEEVQAASASTAIVVHDDCIAREQTLKQEKSTLEQKFDAMTQELSASREEAKQELEREREQARQSQDNLTTAINGVKAQLDRWESGLVSAMECEFKLVRPITAETIPIQMRSRDSQLALQYSKSHEATETDKERMETEFSAKDKEIGNLRKEMERLRSQNAGLRSQLVSLDTKYKDSLAEKETMVTRAVMKEKVMCAETVSKRRYVDLKKQSITIHNEQNVTIEKLKAEITKLKGAVRKRTIPLSEEEVRAVSKHPPKRAATDSQK